MVFRRLGRNPHQGRRTKLTVLGSGTSHGVPVAGCRCPVCRSRDSHDTRFRASLLIQSDAGENIIIDSGPEFRLQVVRAKVAHLDALFITHTHADHLHGLDDVRPFTHDKPLRVYAGSAMLRDIEERFPYIIKGGAQAGGGIPKISFHTASPDIRVGSLAAAPLAVKHGILDILGWKIIENGPSGEKCAVYITDASEVSEATRQLASGCDTLIVGSLRVTPHATHFNFDQAMEFAAELNQCAAARGQAPLRRVFLTHICHNHAHSEIAAYCEDWRQQRGLDIEFAPAYDGLEIEV